MDEALASAQNDLRLSDKQNQKAVRKWEGSADKQTQGNSGSWRRAKKAAYTANSRNLKPLEKALLVAEQKAFQVDSRADKLIGEDINTKAKAVVDEAKTTLEDSMHL